MANNNRMSDVRTIMEGSSPTERELLASSALNELSISERGGVLATMVRNLPADSQKEIATATLGASNPDVQKQVTQEVNSALGVATQPIRDQLWLIVLGAFAFVLVGSFLTLAISVFVPSPVGSTSAQMILTIFTAVIGFLAGLFAPSPVNQQSGNK